MEIVNYLRILRRRWQLVIVCGIVGLALGLSTGLLAPETESTNLYRATHTLITGTDLGTPNSGSGNLLQLETFVKEGDVPRRVAAKIGGSPSALSAQVFPTARPEVGMLQIAAVASEPARAVQMADAFAGELMAYQIELSDRQKDGEIERLELEKERQREIYNDALVQGERDPSQQDYWKRVKDQAFRKSQEIDTKIDEVRLRAPKTSLSTLSTANAVPISGSAFAA